MTRWIARLPLHRKLVLLVLVVTMTALTVASAGVVAVDVWRYRIAAHEDARSLAQVIAENSTAAVAFHEYPAAAETLRTLRVRPVVNRACLYDQANALIAVYDRRGSTSCPQAAPSWRQVAVTSGVVHNGRTIGSVYLERNLSDLWARVGMTAGAAFTMLLVSAGLASVLALRLQRGISRPIRELSDAARELGHNPQAAARTIRAPEDEIGALVTAFSEMADRIRASNAELVSANAALRREVDERRRAEAEREVALQREREASRLKDEFLATVSHELRTPLNAILGWAQFVSATSPDAESTARALASITRNAQVQTRVIEDLLDVSRITTGKLRLELHQIDVREPVHAAADVVRSTAEAKGVTLRIDVPSDPCLVTGDRDRIQQVVGNLLSNATKFTPRGGTVSVGVFVMNGQCELRVTDTGVGIDPGFLPHVFDRFRQADGSFTREHGGLGLGLALVKELTELHGGSARAQSAGLNQGATFTVQLPLAAGVEARAL